MANPENTTPEAYDDYGLDLLHKYKGSALYLGTIPVEGASIPQPIATEGEQ